VADLFAEGVGASVPAIVRETVEAVAAIDQEEVALGQLVEKLKIDKSVVSRRVGQAVKWGYLVNRETRKGRSAWIALGDLMPEEVEVLPKPQELSAD